VICLILINNHCKHVHLEVALVATLLLLMKTIDSVIIPPNKIVPITTPKTNLCGRIRVAILDNIC
jgi:hypothetical protein